MTLMREDGFYLEHRKAGNGEGEGKELPDNALTADIVSAAIAVHRALGPGFLEAIYEEALCVERASRSVPFERQRILRLTYLGKPIGEHRLDLRVDGRVVVELKAVKALESVHFAIVRSYLKVVPAESGLLLNFASMPLTVKRVGREYLPLSCLPDFQIHSDQ